jgi:hypothetical protein
MRRILMAALATLAPAAHSSASAQDVAAIADKTFVVKAGSTTSCYYVSPAGSVFEHSVMLIGGKALGRDTEGAPAGAEFKIGGAHSYKLPQGNCGGTTTASFLRSVLSLHDQLQCPGAKMQSPPHDLRIELHGDGCTARFRFGSSPSCGIVPGNHLADCAQQ